MYDVKQMNKVLKGYVRCMKQPKGCMVVGYAMGFLTEYMQDFKLVSRRMWDIKEEGVSGEVLEGAGKSPCYSKHCPSLCPH